MTEAISCQPLRAEAIFWAQNICDICGEQIGADIVFSQVLLFSPGSIIPPMPDTHISIHCRRYIVFAIDRVFK
jgi:hypothetical protein